MLHYSNASNIEKSRRYLVVKGGACLVALARERGRQLRNRTGQQQRRSRSLPERRGGEIMNTEQTKHHKIYQGNTRCSVCPNAVVGDTDEGGKHPESIPGVSCFRAEEPEGESCGFDRLGVWDGRTDRVSGFVPSF